MMNKKNYNKKQPLNTEHRKGLRYLSRKVPYKYHSIITHKH